MDEYLFITMAKLKADRLRLEREKAGSASAADESADDAPANAAGKRRVHWPFGESSEGRRWNLIPR
jgi:hypothetical protein